MRCVRKTIRCEDGQAMVEFLLSAIFLFTLMFGVVQLVVLTYTFVEMAQAAKAGVRYAVVHGSHSGSSSGPGNTTGVENAVKYYSNHSGMTITVSYPDGDNAPPKRVRVDLSYPFSFIPLAWALPTVTTSAEGRIEF